MIYTFEISATEERRIESEIKIRAKNEAEARELCQNLLRADLEKVYWKSSNDIGRIKDNSKRVGKCVQIDIDIEGCKK